MDYNAYNGPKMTRDQINDYLARIGVKGPVTLDLAGLTKLHKAHQRTVPFENLDILAGKALSLDHEVLFDKIVNRRRGGVCAELNTLYNWLLYSLGFQVTSYSARIARKDDFIEFRRHRVLGVELDDKTYVTDVGSTMEYARMPLLLKEGLVQDDGACLYRYDRHPVYGWVKMQKKPGQDWSRILGFTQEPQLDVDFLMPMFYYEKHPDSNMNKVPRVSCYTETGIMAIRTSAYLIERAGIVEEAVELTDLEEEKRLIRERFHLPTEF